MKTVSYGVRDFQSHLGQAFAEVQVGYRVMVTSRGRPVAMLVRADADIPGASAFEVRLQRLAARGKLRLGGGGALPRRRVPARGGGLSREVLEARGRR